MPAPKKTARRKPPTISKEERQLAYGLLMAEAATWRRLAGMKLTPTEETELYLHRASVLDRVAQEQVR